MLGEIISASVGLGSSIFGGIKAAKAARRQKQALQRASRANDAWYNREYYSDYMNRSDAQSAIKRVRDFMKRRGQQAAATAAVTGATPESVVARRAADNEVIADTAARIQSNADAYKDSVGREYRQRKDALLSGQMGQYAKDEAGGQQMLTQGFQGLANAGIAMADQLGGTKAAATPVPATATPIAAGNPPSTQEAIASLEKNEPEVKKNIFG